MTIGISIRAAAPDDQPAIDDITRIAFDEHRRIYQPSASALSNKLLDLHRIVAANERAILGTVAYRIDSPRLHLIALAVHPAHRRLGVARQLVDHLAQLASRLHLEALSLFTVKETGNPAYFEKLRFRSIREQTDGFLIGIDGQHVTEVYMERAIR
jgi:predicted N-acetyltransferase YhbS